MPRAAKQAAHFVYLVTSTLQYVFWYLWPLKQIQEQLQIERQRAEDAEGRAEQAEGRAEQAEGRAEQAEGRAEQAERRTQPTTLHGYLRGCHDGPFQAFSVQKNKSLTTKGTLTNPEGKICPTYLRPWTGFAEQQQGAFYQLPLTGDDSSGSPRVFASLQYLEELGRDCALRQIASEKDLESFKRVTLENPIAYIIQYLYSQPESRAIFNLSSAIGFENHPNTLSEQADEVIERLERPQPSTPIRSSSPSTTLRADQICVYRTIKKRRTPLLIAEYKAPHKLTLPCLRLGLREMNLKEEVIDRYLQPDQVDVDAVFQYHSDRLAAAVVTQVYSYMIENGLEYSYLTTGEAFVFLQVRPNEPDTVYYHWADPTAEVAEAAELAEDYLSWTAVGQVIAFYLMAFQSKSCGQV